MKKVLSFFVTLVMIVSTTITAFAATVTVPDSLNSHSFVAYQIFTGTQSDTSTVLGNIQWGNGIDSASFLADIKSNSKFGEGDANIFKSCTTAADVAKVLANYDSDSAVANALAKVANDYVVAGEAITLSAGDNDIASGYYLIVDTTNVAGQDDAKNAALLQVTSNIVISEKTDKPEVNKEIKEDSTNTWGVVGDYDISQDVPFRFTSVVPDMTYYDTYKYVFHDEMSAGLTFNNDVVVKVQKEGTGVTTTVDSSKYTVTVGDSNAGDDYAETFYVTIPDLKAIASEGDLIIVEYTAKLNSDAVIGNNGNPNTVYLEYSNNPDGEGTGNTEEHTVVAFTYELDVTKIDGTDASKKLSGAEFKFYRTVDGVNEYVTVDENSKVTGWTTTKESGSTFTSSDVDGKFEIIGLDKGTYYLEETKAPAGYNLLANPITVRINSTISTSTKLITALTVTANGETTNGNITEGSVGINVVNNIGSILPETGGIGTTIFTAVGGALVVGAVVVLIARKKTNSAAN